MAAVTGRNVAFVLELLRREISGLTGEQLEDVLSLVELEEYRRVADALDREEKAAQAAAQRTNRPMD